MAEGLGRDDTPGDGGGVQLRIDNQSEWVLRDRIPASGKKYK